MIKKLLPLILLLASCGPMQVDVSGTVTHKFEIDIENLRKYFIALCEEENAEDVEACADEKTGKFFEYVLGSN